MLAKHMIGYMPSLLVPAITAFASIYCYTRLFTPHEYGYYTLSLSAMGLFNAGFFYWLQVALPRLMPKAIKDGTALQLRTTAYAAFGVSSAILLMAAVIVIGVIPLGDLIQVAWLAVPLALVRSLLTMNQAFHRSALDFKKYNIIECGQAILGFTLGLSLVYLLHMANQGAVLGMMIGMACMLMVDAAAMRRLSRRYYSPAMLKELMRLGLPLIAVCGFTFILSTSDRFLIEHFRGVGEVGVYAAGYSLMDRITQIIFMLVATPSFPLTIHKLEHEGLEAAQAQTYVNGVAMLALALPACAGLILCTHQLAAILIGAEFREAALQVMPWIAASAIIGGLSAHYFDHAFHLAKRPYLMIFTQGPAAALNIGLNLMLIPEYGFMGAAYSTLVSYVVLLILSIILGRRVFAVRFPFRPCVQIAMAVAIMATVLNALTFSYDMTGLILMVGTGGTVYVAALMLFNIMDIRGKVLRRIKR